MYPPTYAPPRKRNTTLWIALLAILALTVVCLCAGGIAVIFLLPPSPARPTPGLVAMPTSTLVAGPERHTPTPTPTATPVVAEPQPDVPTPTVIAEEVVVPFIPDLSDVVSAAFEFEKRSGEMIVSGDGQLIWPDRSVYETAGELYLAAGDDILIWSDEQDGWVTVLPSARLHDNLASWLHLLSYATPIQARAEAGGGTYVDFTVDVPDEASGFGVRGLSGTGWFRWDDASSTLREVSFDLIYRDRLGASLGSQLYMRFTSWGEPVVVPER